MLSPCSLLLSWCRQIKEIELPHANSFDHKGRYEEEGRSHQLASGPERGASKDKGSRKQSMPKSFLASIFQHLNIFVFLQKPHGRRNGFFNFLQRQGLALDRENHCESTLSEGVNVNPHQLECCSWRSYSTVRDFQFVHHRICFICIALVKLKKFA